MPQQHEPQQSTSGQTTGRNELNYVVEDEQTKPIIPKQKNKSQLYKEKTPIEPIVVVTNTNDIELHSYCVNDEENNQQEQQSLMETDVSGTANIEGGQKQVDANQSLTIEEDSQSFSSSEWTDVDDSAHVFDQTFKVSTCCGISTKKVKYCSKSLFELFNLILTVYLEKIWHDVWLEHPNIVDPFIMLNSLWLLVQIIGFCYDSAKGGCMVCILSFAALAVQGLGIYCVEIKLAMLARQKIPK